MRRAWACLGAVLKVLLSRSRDPGVWRYECPKRKRARWDSVIAYRCARPFFPMAKLELRFEARQRRSRNRGKERPLSFHNRDWKLYRSLPIFD